MKFNSLELLKWILQSIAPTELLRVELTLDYFNDWQNQLNSVHDEWKLFIVLCVFKKKNELDKKKWICSLQSQLLVMSNLVNQYINRDKKYWQTNEYSAQIKIFYKKTLELIEDLISSFDQQFPKLLDLNIEISDFRLSTILPPLRNSMFGLKEFLAKSMIDLELATIIVKTLSSFLSSGRLSYAKVKYISSSINEVRALKLMNDESLIELLIKIDFNQPELYLYITNKLNDRIQKIEGLHEAIEYTLLQNNNLQHKDAIANKLHPNQISLRKELQEYYNETKSYLESMLAIRRQGLTDKYDSDHSFRLMIGMSVPQFALFVRILKERGIIVKEGVTEMYTFFASHFYTDKATFISAKNLLKRSTDVEFATALKLWDSFAEMMEWLDEKFSIRNYQRSMR